MNHFPAATLLCAYILVAFPWTDQLYLHNFQVNYLWPSALTLYIVVLLFVDKHNRCPRIALLSLILGCWNEAFTLPLLFGETVVLLNGSRSPINKRILYSWIGLFFGAVWILLCHNYFNIKSDGWFSGRQIVYIPYAMPFVFFFITVMVKLVRGKSFFLLQQPLIAYMLSSSMASTILMCYSNFGARVGVVSILFSAVGIGRVLHRLYSISRIRLFFSSVLMFLCVIHCVAVAVMCYDSKNLYVAVMEHYQSCCEPTEPLWIDMPLRQDAPGVCLQKTYYDFMAHRATLNCYEQLFLRKRGYKPTIKVIPASIKDKLRIYPPRPIEGSARLGAIEGSTNFRAIDGYGYIVGPPVLCDPVKLSVDYGYGFRIRSYHTVRFVFPSLSYVDNKYTLDTLCWYYPEQTFLDAILSPIPLRADTLP